MPLAKQVFKLAEMEIKHSKGYWSYRFQPMETDEDGGTSGCSGFIQVKNSEKPYPQNLAFLAHWRDENKMDEAEANCRLMAAAPRMLSVLKEIRAWYEENQHLLPNEETPVCFSKALSTIIEVS